MKFGAIVNGFILKQCNHRFQLSDDNMGLSNLCLPGDRVFAFCVRGGRADGPAIPIPILDMTKLDMTIPDMTILDMT